MYLESDSPINFGGHNNCDGFGNQGWWVIILFALIFGWGRGGFGNGTDSGIASNYALGADVSMLSRQMSDGFASQERKLDSISNGICDGFYAQNTNLLNGFSGIQQTLCQGFGGINTGLVQQGYETRLGINDIEAQLANCCCDLKTQISNTNYNLAQNFATTNYNMAKNTCDIIQSGKDNTQRIIDYMTAKDNQALRDENFALRLAASQANQNNYLINKLSPCPIPAYNVPNPNCCYNQCGCTNGSIL